MNSSKKLCLLSLLVFVFFFLSNPLQLQAGTHKSFDFDKKGMIEIEVVTGDSPHYYFYPDTRQGHPQTEKRVEIDSQSLTKIPGNELLYSGLKVKLQGKRAKNGKNGKTERKKLWAEKIIFDQKAAKNFEYLRGQDSGERKLAVVLISLLDAPANQDITSLESSLEVMKLNYQLTSFNKVNFNLDGNGDGRTDIFGPIAVPWSKSDCTVNYFRWANKAKKLALKSGIDLDQYSNVMYVIPEESECAWKGISNFACTINCRNIFRTVTVPGIFTHEIGHNFGLHHASSGELERGDFSDPMSNDLGFLMKGFNAPHLLEAGWFDQNSNFFEEITIPGVYRLRPLYSDATSVPGVRVYKMKGLNYYFSYRQKTGSGNVQVEEGVPDTYTTGVNIHIHGGARDRTNFVNALIDNQSWTDGWLSLTQLASSEDYVDVKVDFNYPPVVDAGQDQVLQLPQAFLNLRGVAVDHGGGSITSLIWELVQAPDPNNVPPLTPALSSPSIGESTLSLKLTRAGVYIFKLTATDDKGVVSFDEVQVTVLP